MRAEGGVGRGMRGRRVGGGERENKRGRGEGRGRRSGCEIGEA